MNERVVLRNARLADGRAVDVHIVDGLIAAVDDAVSVAAPASGERVHDLHGRLLLPAMAEPHAHLDKALLADDMVNRTGDMDGAIEAMIGADPALYTPGHMAARAHRALELLLVNGVTAVRSHVNVGEEVGADWVKVIDEVRQDFVGLMDVQLVAIMHSPLTGKAGAGNRRALDLAIDAGIDLVGGCPALDDDGPGLISHVLDVAAANDRAIDLHVDETLDVGMLTLRELARQVRDRGFTGAVAASHCCSLAVQDEATQEAVAAEVADAGIAVIPLPQTNLYLQGRQHRVSVPRALAPIDVLRRAGVTVAAGGDNVQDPFNPVGRSDPLETASLLVVAGHQFANVAYDMVSNEARAAMGMPRITMAVGDPADLVAIDAPNTRAAVADAPADRMVFRRGRLVATTTRTTAIHR